MFFTSDNASPAPQQIIDALIAANSGPAGAYGGDDLSAQVQVQIRDVFEAPEARVFLVGTGTAANALTLATLCPPWGTIFCHHDAHIAVDECGAPEFFTGGAKLTLLDGSDGKIDAAELSAALDTTGANGVHGVQKGAASITNATEAGTVYTPDEVRQIATLARAHNISLHMDGARFANALSALNCSPADLTWRAGVDALCFGGTKNGLLGVEAVIMFNPEHAWEFELRRKRGGHLASKHRYLAAQMQAYLTDDLWLDLARSANSAAARLANGLMSAPGATLNHPVQANEVFATLPRAAHERLLTAGAAYYPWPEGQAETGAPDSPYAVRLVTSWCTSDAEVDAFLELLAGG